MQSRATLFKILDYYTECKKIYKKSCYDKSKIDKGLKYFDYLVRVTGPIDSTPFICLGRIFSLIGAQSVFATYYKALKFHPNDYSIHLWLARAYLNFNYPKDAIETFAVMVRGQHQLITELTEDEINAIDHYLTLKVNADAYLCRAFIFYHQNKLHKAKHYFETVIQFNPKEAIAYFYLAKITVKISDTIANYRAALSLNPTLALHWNKKDLKDLQKYPSDFIQEIKPLLEPTQKEWLALDSQNKQRMPAFNFFGCLSREVKISPLIAEEKYSVDTQRVAFKA